MRAQRPRARTTRRFGWALALLALACALGAPPAPAAVPLLPDLVADPPVSGKPPVVYGDAEGSRLLLRLDGFVHNRGPGALEILGSDPVGSAMGTVRQRVYDDGGGFSDLAHVPSPTVVYETNDDHRHWHLRNAMRFSLWSADRTAEVAPGQKVGFCLQDSEPIEAPSDAPGVYDGFCRIGEPDASSVSVGVSSGWRDIYPYVLAFQWVDISNVAPGRYWLRADADPDGVIAETDEANAGAYDADMSVVNGYRADPVAAGAVPAQGATTIPLAATTFDDVHPGSPGAREFQIVTPPAGGTLDQPADTWFSGSDVRYTPNPGFSGPDAFTVAARDATSPFPRTPPSAAVTLTVQAPLPAPRAGVLGISNAPKSVYTSSQTRLRASGPGVAQGVSWSVDGVVGGGGSVGRISVGGLYTAPKARPSRGSVVIDARSATGATGQVAIGIVRSPTPRAAPAVKPPRVPRRGLSRIRLQLRERTLIAVVSSARTGRVRFSAARGGRRVGRCSMVVRRGGAAACKLRVPPTHAARPSAIVVRATLARGGKIVARRRAILR